MIGWIPKISFPLKSLRWSSEQALSTLLATCHLPPTAYRLADAGARVIKIERP